MVNQIQETSTSLSALLGDHLANCSSVIVLILMVPFIIILFALCFIPTRDFTTPEPFHGLSRFGVAAFLLDSFLQSAHL